MFVRKPGINSQTLALAVAVAGDREQPVDMPAGNTDGPWRRVAGVFGDDGSVYEKWCRSSRDAHGRLTEQCTWRYVDDDDVP